MDDGRRVGVWLEHDATELTWQGLSGYLQHEGWRYLGKDPRWYDQLQAPGQGDRGPVVRVGPTSYDGGSDTFVGSGGELASLLAVVGVQQDRGAAEVLTGALDWQGSHAAPGADGHDPTTFGRALGRARAALEDLARAAERAITMLVAAEAERPDYGIVEDINRLDAVGPEYGVLYDVGCVLEHVAMYLDPREEDGPSFDPNAPAGPSEVSLSTEEGEG